MFALASSLKEPFQNLFISQYIADYEENETQGTCLPV
jgi:hypothetical protein